MIAYILINTEFESEREVLEAIRKIESVKEAHVVQGVYDIVAKIEVENMNKLKETVNWKLRRLNKVKSTLTMIIMD